MADETAPKRPLFGSQAKPPESSTASTAGADTSSGDDNRPESEVSDKEANALKGDGGPGI